VKKLFVPLFWLTLVNSANAQVVKPVDVFFKLCMGALGDLSQGEASAQNLGFAPATEEQKKTLLRRGSLGSVYVGDGLAVVLEKGGLCTIFAHTEDRTAVQEDLKKALPPPSTPFKVSEEPIGGNSNVTGTVYRLTLPTGPFADWIFSSYAQPGKYNVAISMQIRRKE